MRIKTLLYVSLVFILVFVIYLTTLDREVYYLNIGLDNSEYSYDNYIYKYLKDKNKLEKYITGFVHKDDRVTDIIHMIEENESLVINDKKQTIKNALIKSDLVTISIGLNDINYKIGYSSINELYDYADSFLNDMNDLFEVLREYCKEDIILLGYYNSFGSYYDEYFGYINREIASLAKEYNIEFISLSEVYDTDNHMDTILMNEQENKVIAKEIIKIIDNKILK